MSLEYNNIHSLFKLNGIPVSFDNLEAIGYNLVKDGESFEKPIGNFLMDWADPSDSIEVTTSGSTGIPKKIRLKKQHMVNSAMATGSFFNLKAGNSALLCLPADFIAGKMMLVRAMVLGLSLDYAAPSSNPLKGVEKKYDFVAMIPLQVENSLDKLNQVVTLIVGGAKMSTKLKSKTIGFNTNVYETYGMTETITHIAAKKIDTLEVNSFKVLPNVSITVDDRSCLVINAPNIADDVVVTNDVVRIISESEFEWLGRFDTIINSGGVKLIPEKIETKLSSILNTQFFVAGIPDEKLGQKLVLIIEAEKKDLSLIIKVQELNSLEKFEVPKQIFFIKQFVMTENGKIQRLKTLDLI